MKSKSIRRALFRASPWLVTAIACFAIVRRYSLASIAAALGAGHAAGVFPIAIAFGVVQYLLLAGWDASVLRSVVGGPRYLDVLRAKSGCAVLQSLGYLFNQGAYGTWIARSTGASAGAAAAVVLYFAACDLAAGAFVATFAVRLAGDPHAAGAVVLWGAPIVALVACALLLVPERRPLALDERPSLAKVFRAVPRGRVLLQIAGRSINVGLIIFAIWGAARTFGLAIPLAAAISLVPVIMLVGAMPVNVFGFGPVQGAWLLFAAWAPGPSILAFQLVWNVAYLAASIVRGGAFIPGVMRRIAEGAVPARTDLEYAEAR